jgi:hypothetical protein
MLRVAQGLTGSLLSAVHVCVAQSVVNLHFCRFMSNTHSTYTEGLRSIAWSSTYINHNSIMSGGLEAVRTFYHAS